MWLFDIFRKKKEKQIKRRKLIIICSIASTVAIIGIIVPCVVLLGKKNKSEPPKLIISGDKNIIAVKNQFGQKQYTANETAVSWSLTGDLLPIGLIITWEGLLSWTHMVTSIVNTFEFTIVIKKEGFENGALSVSFAVE